MTFNQKLSQIFKRYEDLTNQLNAGVSDSKELIKLSKEYSSLEEVAITIKQYLKIQENIIENQAIIDDITENIELKELALMEITDLNKQQTVLQKTIQLLLVPKDVDDERNAIIEIRAGTGGDEAALFAADLLRMYQKYAETQKWKIELMDCNDTGIGGIKEVSVNIAGKGVFSKLKFESGVHRVQRVPATESSGRIHTSAATVAVLPEVEDVDINIAEKDLRIDVFRSSGPGGQSVNTTDSAVRITHIPTGVVVSQQDEKSQHKNKAKAMKILRARLYEFERQKKDKERASTRKQQIGTGDRSERIRTYNFPQGRVTDHRINLTLYKLEAILSGNLNELIEPLIVANQADLLVEIA